MPRAVWKGAISFGLVHVPVSLYPASGEGGIDFDWLDKRTMDPVGYKRINKRTGREIDKSNIVKGVKVESGDYVVLSDEEVEAAYPKTTKTIALESFVQAAEVPFTYLDRPYYLEPLAGGEKVYALLREAMAEARVIGIARVVMHVKEHLAALIPAGPTLLLNTLRWDADVRPPEDLKLPPEGKASFKPAELKMATQLIGDMTAKWRADHYEDQFTAAVQALVKQRVKAGKTAQVEPLEDATPPASNVVDLTELLAQSLRRGTPAQKAASPAGKQSAAAKQATAKKAAGKKVTAKAATAKQGPARKRA
jgi:DNA end-binding protein Ku